MSASSTFSAESGLEELKSSLEDLDDGYQVIRRLEKDFGNNKQQDLFISTDDYNAYLYSGHVDFHFTEDPLKMRLEDDEVLDLLDDFYDCDLGEMQEELQNYRGQ